MNKTLEKFTKKAILASFLHFGILRQFITKEIGWAEPIRLSDRMPLNYFIRAYLKLLV